MEQTWAKKLNKQKLSCIFAAETRLNTEFNPQMAHRTQTINYFNDSYKFLWFDEGTAAWTLLL